MGQLHFLPDLSCQTVDLHLTFPEASLHPWADKYSEKIRWCIHHIVRLLLHNRANVNAQEGIFGTALKLAAGSKNETVVQLLLDSSAVSPNVIFLLAFDDF